MRSTIVLLALLPSLEALSFQSSVTKRLTRQPEDGIVSRRHLLELSSGIALANLLGVKAARASEPQTIVITGANSGIGFEASKRLAAGGNRLILACRSMSKAEDTVNRLAGVGGTLIPAECDLASLKSIDAFAESLKSLVSVVDVLCLNAGMARNTAATDVARTAEGFELTVGTNHFGHFYLNNRVLPQMKPDGGRIVVTSSGVHDPESPGGAQGVPATLGDLSGLEKEGKKCEMIDGGTFNADKAYKDSKLCNVLFTRELQRRLKAEQSTAKITTNCFNPGLIVGTGLFRDQNPLFTKLFDVAATDLFKVGESPSFGGGCLEYMTKVATSGEYYSSPPGSVKFGDAAYGNQFKVETVSKEAQDDTKAKRLWELSSRALGLSS